MLRLQGYPYSITCQDWRKGLRISSVSTDSKLGRMLDAVWLCNHNPRVSLLFRCHYLPVVAGQILQSIITRHVLADELGPQNIAC